jgi:hypothetical protein
MIKHLEQQIFQQEMQIMTNKKQSNFFQNVFDFDDINDFHKA